MTQSATDRITQIATDPQGEKRRPVVSIVHGRIRPYSVFVPWETLADGRTVRCRDLPRFADVEQARTYMFCNGALARRRISWVEDFSDLAKDELLAGYGSRR